MVRQGHGVRVGRGLARGDACRKWARREDDPLLTQRHTALVVGRRGEEETVLHHNLVGADGDAERLVQVGDFLQLGRWCVVGEQDAVATEVAVVRRFAIVAAVSEVLAAMTVDHRDRLVGEVPDEPALEQRFAIGEIDVAVHGAKGVSHRVGVLAQDKRLVAVLGEVHLDVCGGCVHLADHVGGFRVARVPVHSLVVDGTVVDLTEVVGDVPDDGSAEGFVTARPHHHAGVVFVPLEKTPGAILQRRHPHRVVAGHRLARGQVEMAEAVPQPVRFEVHLVDDHHPVLVRQLVEEGVIGVVAGADGVDTRTLEYLQVSLGLLAGHHSSLQTKFVPVDTKKHNPLAVQTEDAILDGEPSKTHRLRDDLGLGAVAALRAHNQLVEVRVFRAPQPGVGDTDAKMSIRVLSQRAHASEINRRRSVALELQLDGDLGGVVASVCADNIRGDVEVLHVHRRTPEKDNIAEETGEAEEVLVFQPGDAAPFEDLRGQAVLPIDECRRDIEFGGGEGIGRVPDIGAIQPEGDRAFCPANVDRDPFARGEWLIESESGDVRRDRVELCRRLTGLDLLVAVPGVLGVDVLRAIVAVELDVSGNRDGVPSAHIKFGLFEARDSAVGARCIVELPRSVQGVLEPADTALHLGVRPKPAVIGMRGATVLTNESRIREAREVESHLRDLGAHLMAPVMPLANERCRIKNTIIVGSDARRTASISTP